MKKTILAVLFGILAIGTITAGIGCDDSKSKTEAKASTEKK